MDPTQNGETPPVMEEKVNINGTEYDVSQASELIGLGQKTRENETKWNTKLDSVWPEYGKVTTTLKQRETELAEARQKLAQYEQKKDAGTETPLDVKQAQDAARKLNIVLRDDLEKDGYVKKADLDKYLEERDSQKASVQQVLTTAEKLEKEIDGADGRPRFNKKHVLAYASAYGISDLKAAYEDMYGDQLKAWQEGQIASKKSPGLKTFKSGSPSKQPAPVTIDDSNVQDALKEALWGSKE